MTCNDCGRRATLWNYGAAGWLCWRCRWPGWREVRAAAKEDIPFHAGRAWRQVRALWWRAVYAVPGMAGKLQAGQRCPVCRQGDLLAVLRHQDQAGMVFWGFACDNEEGCDVHFPAPGFHQRAEAQRRRFLQVMVGARAAR